MSERSRDLEAELDGLEVTIASTETMTSAFARELEQVRSNMNAANREVAGLSKTLSGSLTRAFDSMVLDGANFSDVFQTFGRSLVRKSLNAAINPINDAIGGGIASVIGSILPFANGAAFSAGRVSAFAKGGVVSSPTSFPMRGGTGLMGEAGPEAIMPLTRAADGSLGVRAAGSGASVNVTMNVSTPDLAGFRRSKGQVAAQISRAIARGQRNM